MKVIKNPLIIPSIWEHRIIHWHPWICQSLRIIAFVKLPTNDLLLSGRLTHISYCKIINPFSRISVISYHQSGQKWKEAKIIRVVSLWDYAIVIISKSGYLFSCLRKRLKASAIILLHLYPSDPPCLHLRLINW